jgi:peroxiredoxin
MTSNEDYPYEWKKKKRFGLKQVLLSIGIIAVVVIGANLIPKLISQESLTPTPTPSYIERGSRKIPSVIPGDVEFPAPDLNLTDLEGKPVSLGDYRGQVVMVNNWGIECPFCEAEMAEYEAYYNDYKDQGLTIIGINADDTSEDIEAYIQEMEMTFPIWLDPKKEAYQAFKNNNIPSTYVIDKNGTVQLAWSGPASQAILEEFVTPLLHE